MDDFKGEIWNTEVGKATEKLARTLIGISKDCDVMIQAQYITLASLIMTRMRKFDRLEGEEADMCMDQAIEKFKTHLKIALNESRNWKSDAKH